MAPFAPFQVDPESIERLGPAFTQYVNELLAREAARAPLLGHQLRVDKSDTTADGGVDATLDAPESTKWIASGKSCWQFKRGDLAPAKCAKELEGATWALDMLRGGATYTLVLGRCLGDKKIETRRSKLIEKAKELGVVGAGDRERIQVLDANALARWSSEFPSLAVSPVLGGPGYGVSDFDRWSSSNRHSFHWVPNAQRDDAVDVIRRTLAAEQFSEIHITGLSGVGKTRLAMEALRAPELAPLVVYLPDSSAVGGDVLGYILGEGRAAILVVDECGGRTHEKFAERVPAMSALRLLTIGEPDTYPLRSPVIELTTMSDEEVESFLKANHSQLSPEHRRFVSEQSDGNVRMAILLARGIEQGGEAAADLISRGEVEQFLQVLLPEGRPFQLATVLALVERVGWDKEVAGQLRLLADFAGVAEDELREVGRDLESRGLFVRQGRYRAIAPNPVAVVLAASAWREDADRIVNELLPQLDQELALALFSRVAALGRYEPARRVLRKLMSRTGPFGSLESIESQGLGRFLTQLAIVAPDETMEHLGDLIEAASLHELRDGTGSRRDLVWTLEKLVWHRATFERGADSLLKLALAENETWANNATRTWIDLFGTMLPGTAAKPSERAAYLERIGQSEDPAVRLLAIRACERVLVAIHESIAVSGELQGGSLVEPRGSPTTWGEAADYRRSAIALLSRLATDQNADVSTTARGKLIGAVHTLVDDGLVGDDLVAALVGLPRESLGELRREVAHLISLHERHTSEERPHLLERLKALASALPPATQREQLHVLLQLRRWDMRDEELQSRFTESLRSIDSDDLQWLLELAKEEELPAAWELGVALGEIIGEDHKIERSLVDAFPRNAAALLGYLQSLVEAGDAAAFDRFLQTPLANDLEPRSRLLVAARGPATEQSKARVLAIAEDIPVADATNALFASRQDMSGEETAHLVALWSERVASQQDYDALVDWINLRRRGDDALPEPLRPDSLRVVLMRLAFPKMGQTRWDWAQLATQFVNDHPLKIATLILDLIDSDELMIHSGDSDAQVLMDAAKAEPAAIWDEVAGRIAAGSWRLQMEIRGWLIAVIPDEIVTEWIGDDVARARLVASVALVGTDSPLPLTRFLLDRFGDDEHVRSSLWSQFASGMWSGPESARLATQIEQLRGWERDRTEPAGVRGWATQMIESLEMRREQALQDEAERGY